MKFDNFMEFMMRYGWIFILIFWALWTSFVVWIIIKVMQHFQVI